MNNNIIKIWFDGSSSPHKHNGAGWAYVVQYPITNIENSYCGSLPTNYTNNQAEIYALIKAIEFASTLEGKVIIAGDSKLAVDWWNGNSTIKNFGLLKIIEDNLGYTYLGKGIEVKWIPRKENKADWYAKLAKSNDK